MSTTKIWCSVGDLKRMIQQGELDPSREISFLPNPAATEKVQSTLANFVDVTEKAFGLEYEIIFDFESI